MERSRTNNPPTRLRAGIAALGLAMSFAIGTGTVHAAGTASGTSISNQATLSYSVGVVPQPPIASSPTGVGPAALTTFVVDNRVNLTVTTTDATFVSVVPGSTAQVTTFSVTNAGNTVQDFTLVSAQEATGTPLFGFNDNFDTPACSQFVESGVTAGYQVGADTATFIDELAADASRTVYVVCSIPAGQINNDHAVVSLTATARAGATAGLGAALAQSPVDTAGVDIVFGDAAGTDDAARDAAHSSRSAYRVVSATLNVAKTATLICDPLNSTTNPKNIPAAIVRWTITITNNGAASATLSTVTDAISASTTFDANLITGAGGVAGCSSATGTPESLAGRGFKLSIGGGTRPAVSYPKFFTTANDADAINLNAGTVTVNYAAAMPVEPGYIAGELKPTESVTVYFNVTVN